MFSGIVQCLGKVVGLTRSPSMHLSVEIQNPMPCNLGDSISINGVCLTVVQIHHHIFEFDVVPETERRTNLTALNVGDPVNIEFSLRLQDVIGGHLVQGHVDACCPILQMQSEKNSLVLTIEVPRSISAQLVEKGCIGIDGMSITLIDIQETCFTVALIPHTLSRTIAQFYQVGTRVNLEVDLFSKYVLKHLRSLQHEAYHAIQD